MSLTPDQIQYQLAHSSDDAGPSIIISTAIMLSVAIITTILRFIARRLSGARLLADDWMMLAGLFWTILYTAGCYVCIHFGMGKHAILITQPIPFAKTVLITECTIGPALLCIKCSILLLYRRLFPNRSLKIALIATALFVIPFSLAQPLSVILQCTPPAALWDPASYPDAHCIDYTPPLIFFVVVNALTDIWILALPLPILWNLKVSFQQRIRLIGIFCLGALVCVVGFVRCGYANQVSVADDPSWSDVSTVILSGVEICAGILCANVPTLLPIWQYLRHGSIQGSQSATNQSRSKMSGMSKSHGARLRSEDGYELSAHDSVRHLSQASDEEYASWRCEVDKFEGRQQDRTPHAMSPGIHVTTDVKVSDRNR